MYSVSGLGMWEPCGHVDVYPNGGRDMPGCDEGLIESIWTEGLVEGTSKAFYIPQAAPVVILFIHI